MIESHGNGNFTIYIRPNQRERVLLAPQEIELKSKIFRFANLSAAEEFLVCVEHYYPGYEIASSWNEKDIVWKAEK